MFVPLDVPRRSFHTLEPHTFELQVLFCQRAHRVEAFEQVLYYLSPPSGTRKTCNLVFWVRLTLSE